MSITSQRSELERKFGVDVEIVEVIEEAYSAKAPGRPLFNAMMERIERGEAQGLVAWAPDRLARNSIDGGRIVYQLDTGLLRDLKFATYTFENNPQGKFMLSIMFGQSKYYSDALSENVKRGNRTKVESGWRPNLAPLGYLNDAVSKTIIKDPVHFPLVRRIFDLILTGAYTPREVALIARDEWGFRTPKRRKIGGVPLALSSIYGILRNPFYAGIIAWNGAEYPGKHPPILSIEEFERVRQMLDRPSRPAPKTYTFPFTTLMRCGRCGRAVTAEHKVNRHGTHYIYYHCTKGRLGPRCPEPSVQQKEVERQFEEFLASLAIPPQLETLVVRVLKELEGSEQEVHAAHLASLARSSEAVEAELQELLSLRLRNLLRDDEYLASRRQLEHERLRLAEAKRRASTSPKLHAPLEEIISFSNCAVDFFRQADERGKRMIIETACSNPLLSEKKLRVQAAKPFLEALEFAERTSRLATDATTRTQGTLSSAVARLSALLEEPQTQHVLRNIRVIRQHFDHSRTVPDDVAGTAGKARRAAASTTAPRRASAARRSKPHTAKQTPPRQRQSGPSQQLTHHSSRGMDAH